jgi:hypothetical protein
MKNSIQKMKMKITISTFEKQFSQGGDVAAIKEARQYLTQLLFSYKTTLTM